MTHTKDETLRHRIRVHIANREHYSKVEFLDKLHEILHESEQTAAPMEEPVAWMYPDDYERMTNSETFCTVYSVEVGSATRGESTVALYTTPPAAQRQWVGLTDKEMYLNCPNWLSHEQCKTWVQQIEAKIKEKNT